ncbi:MAG: lipoyl(octanoyl) transferase LipB [Bacteroidia bacterium]|nr:lipoyl(octanoyl) transferase LipB [Bacteroidia bacterium]MCX7652054.1 lipoyl(octanoyl) transferase LipB [Bacteroidia bacterium]MDW8416275.1 lipoyl(octanoyl) transferase LipB [Bacteroidia bacterium]
MAASPQLSQKPVLYEDWGLIPYGIAWTRQRTLLQEALSNLTAWQDRLILCEHPPVITLGRNAHEDNILFPEPLLRQKGVEIYAVERGGDVTYHGPGQIVGYPILWLERYKADVGWYMRSLEEVIIRTIGDWGLRGERLAGLTGVWLLSPPRKIAAMGVKLSRWVSMHGFALNVNTDLSGFSYIVPCGIRDKAVTSMARELGYAVSMDAVKASLRQHFADVFAVEMQMVG